MQIDIRQQRRYHRPLWSAHLRLRPFSLFADSCLQPFLDEAQDPLVGDPVLDKPHRPFVTHLVEKAPNVGVQNPIHPLPLNAHAQRVERLMRTASRPEPVAESPKVHFINLIENGDHGLLDNFVLQRRDPDRTLPSISFRYVDPLTWLCAIRAPVNPVLQIGDPILQPLLVLPPRHTVYSRRRVLLQRVKTRP